MLEMNTPVFICICAVLLIVPGVMLLGLFAVRRQKVCWPAMSRRERIGNGRAQLWYMLAFVMLGLLMGVSWGAYEDPWRWFAPPAFLASLLIGLAFDLWHRP